jgi:hypothetical protein
MFQSETNPKEEISNPTYPPLFQYRSVFIHYWDLFLEKTADKRRWTQISLDIA